MRSCLLAFGFFLITLNSVQAQSASSSRSTVVTDVPSPTTIHGIGFSRMSNYNPERSYKKARESAFIDLEASLLTSVMLEYYGTDNSPSRLRSEFAISDSIQSEQVINVDSVHIGEWAVYYLADQQETYSFPQAIVDAALMTSWIEDLYTPKNIDGFWIAAGSSKATSYNPNRGWTRAKQHALTQLSEFLNTKVQSLERLTNENLETVHYVTSKHIFNNIGVIGRRVIDDKYVVLVIVDELNVIQLED